MDVVLPKPGVYVLAISGGVDSRVLLDILYTHSRKKAQWELVVAHLDHGIRDNSGEDRKFVQSLAKQYGLPFVSQRANLGKTASEAEARHVRYTFLRQVQKDHQAQAIITAHHRDDVLETAIINIVRGTRRKGVTALRNRPDLLRPLLRVPKAELINYAQSHELTWHEDDTNQDDRYLRNYIRHQLLPSFDEQATAQFLAIIDNLQSINAELDALLAEQLQQQENTATITRLWFNNLPHAVAREILAAWFREQHIRNFDSKTLERLVVAAKTAQPGLSFPVRDGYNMKVEKEYLALEPAER